MLGIKFLCVFNLFFLRIRATTHWMVTENGLIQPRSESPFEMARPYDLLAFLNQDTRWDNIIELYHDLNNRKDLIKQIWNRLESDTDINTQLSINDDCLKANPLHSSEWYDSLFEDGQSREIPVEYFLLHEPKDDENVDIPDCKKISSLTFSMHAFEHLEGMTQRQNLSTNPELLLPEQISALMTVDQFGHWLAGVLKKNSSSWLHYNLASIYWRVQGNAPKAMECSRRAVHYSPREYKDIALLSMGIIFHRAKMTDDAITVLGAAVDHAPEFSINHFLLANAFAVLGDYNNSMIHLDQAIEINPSFELAKKHKYGVLCHKIVKEKIINIQGSLVKLREELYEYGQREANWLKLQASFLRTMYHDEKFDYTNVEKNCEKMSTMTGFNIRELKKEGDKNSLIQYFFDGPMYNEKWLSTKGIHAIESVFSLQRLIQHIEKHANMISDYVAKPDLLKLAESRVPKEITLAEFFESTKEKASNEVKENKRQSDKNKVSEEDSLEYETGVPLYPNSITVGRNTEDFDLDPNWPSLKFCKESAPLFPKNINQFYPVFLPFENKGIKLQTLLTDKIGYPAHVEHDLPWHPPTCPHDKDSTSLSTKKSKKLHVMSEVGSKEYLKRKLLEYVGNGNVEIVKHMQEAEIGHRIYKAIQMKLAPKWILYTLASLYWRVRGEAARALACLRAAERAAPRHRDLVLASLASVYLEAGQLERALAAAEEAFRLGLYEPATNFVLAQMNMYMKHRNTQMYHLKQVVRVEPTFMGGFGRTLLNAWICAIKESENKIETSYNDDCTQVPDKTAACAKDGSHYGFTNIHYFNSKDEIEESSFLKILDLNGDEDEDDIDEGFLKMVEEMAVKTDRLGHRKNYERMRRSLDSLLKDCEPQGCVNVKQSDFALQESDCTYQHLQLEYWLNIISFRHLINDGYLKMPLEITSFQPSSNSIPDCKLPIEPADDFFLERLSKIDLEGWEPLLNYMQQIAEFFDYYDYVTLGAKISQYVETRPRSWAALLAAGWWCGAGGRAACCVRCAMAAYAHAPPERARAVLLSLAALTHMQSKLQDTKDIAYLMFYLSPKNKLEAFLVAVSHTYMREYEQAIWMYRYTLSFDEEYVPARACLHATVCLLLFGETSNKVETNQ